MSYGAALNDLVERAAVFVAAVAARVASGPSVTMTLTYIPAKRLVFSDDWTYREGTCPPKSRGEVEQVLFRTGDRTWQAGIYRSGCCGFEIAIGKGGTFPVCRKCGLSAGWTLTKLTSR
jgi:hypothetical protein